MKVLLVGATGNVGLRLVAALLAHGHILVAYVRSSNKLESLLPKDIYSQITVVEGNATDSTMIKRAILENQCDAVVNSAGLAAVAPWSSSDFPKIFAAVVEGTQQAGSERDEPLRAWFLGGMGVLEFPGTNTMLSSYVPILLEHGQNIKLLRSLPPGSLDWSMLCPSEMVPENSAISTTRRSTHGKLTVNAKNPPLWKNSWMKHIPLLGKIIVIGMNFPRYKTTLEQNADFIASDLEDRDSRWIGLPVGTIDASR